MLNPRSRNFNHLVCINAIILSMLVILYTSCKKEISKPSIGQNPNAIAPTGFNFKTTQSVKINVQLLSNLGEPLVGVPVSFHSSKDTTELLIALTNKQGIIDTKLEIASYLKELIVKPHSVGLIKEVKAFFTDQTLKLNIGGKNGLSGNVAENTVKASNKSTIKNFQSGSTASLNTTYSYLGTYDGNGRPNYLTPQPGRVSAELLAFLNNSLPEEKNIVSHHLVYLSPAANRDLDVIETSEIFITYVSEGASNHNSLGYYTYPTGNKPATINQISEIKYIFPNTSGIGSGGNLVSGDKVSLGVIKAGFSVGLVMFSNGWDINSQAITRKYEQFFSDENLNPELNRNFKQHSVLLDYEQENLVVVGFEDINRESGKSDDDFNDVILYLSSSEAHAISKKNIIKLTAPIDSDGDGISDDNDQYPGDSKKVYDTFYPSKNGWGTLAFEDIWPNRGDYDMNDLVVNYRYSYALNANNEITEMKADYKVNQSLAYYKNGFGVELPINQNVIDDVRGYINTEKYIKYNQNGTEAGQNNAVIIPFDNQKSIFDATVNYSEPIRVLIIFLKPQPINLLNNVPYNPFLISDGRRSYEIHLPGYKPTNKADLKLFGSGDDLSNPSIGNYYIGENNWPWALHFAETFNYPSEKEAINEKFPLFKDWAASGGNKFLDWYK